MVDGWNKLCQKYDVMKLYAAVLFVQGLSSTPGLTSSCGVPSRSGPTCSCSMAQPSCVGAADNDGSLRGAA